MKTMTTTTTAIKRALFGLASASAMLWASTALPCGGAFGPNVTVSASQTLLVAHKAGLETYVFRPHFCGEAAQFGLILPIPATLSKNPALGDPELFSELDRLSAPEIVKKKVCKNSPEAQQLGAGASKGGGVPNDGAGVDVINKGQVGIFDWTLVKADTKAAFTDWLDTNGFPHNADADTQFSHYVTEGWYFVAFKVTAGDNAPPVGKKLCGDFGPIELAFQTANPVVPTRIAAVSANGHAPSWRVYGLSSSASQLGITAGAPYPAMTSYSDELNTTALATAPQLSKLATAGDRLVRLEVGFAFNGLQNDMFLAPNSPQKLHTKSEQIELVDCPTTTPNPSPSPSGTSESPATETTPPGGYAPSSADGCAVSGEGHESGLAATIALTLAVMLVRRRRSSSTAAAA